MPIKGLGAVMKLTRQARAKGGAPHVFTSIALTTVLTGLCAPGEREYVQEILAHDGNIEVEIHGGYSSRWPAFVFSAPVYQVRLEDIDKKELFEGQCAESIDCFSEIELPCAVCYTDVAGANCWQTNPDTEQGQFDCTGIREYDESDKENKYYGEFTLTLETAAGEETKVVYFQTYKDPERSCEY